MSTSAEAAGGLSNVVPIRAGRQKKQRERAARSRWILRGEIFEVRLAGGESYSIAFAHKAGFKTEAVIMGGGGEVLGRASTQLSPEDTYSQSEGRILALTRALHAAALPRATRSALWAVMPDVRRRRGTLR
jgi:hypothetical protein